MLLDLNARNLPRAAIFNGRRFSEPDLGICGEPSFTIARGDRVYGIGSCFARAVGNMLAQAGYPVTFGGLYHRYNIFNILQTVRWGLEGGFGPEHLIELENGQWYDPHGLEESDHVYDSRDRALELSRGALAEVGKAIRSATVMVLTLGLVEVWRDEQTDVWLNLMPPRKLIPDFDRRFTMHKTRQAENATAITSLFKTVRADNPALKIICSVSPIPLRATFCFGDVLVATAYGKATLRSALQEAIDDAKRLRMAHIDYFPSFEIVSFQRNNGVYKPVNAAGKPDHLHIREEFLERSVRKQFRAAYLAPAARPAEPPVTPAQPARLAG